MTPQEIRDAIAADPALQALVPDTVALAAHPTFAGITTVEPRMLTTRGVRALPGVLPRSRHALLQVLKDAANATPAWFVPTLTALGVPSEDHAAMADDLASAWDALNAFAEGGGLDVGSAAARGMLDIIAASVPESAAACTAVKALAEVPAPVAEFEIRKAIIADDGTSRV